MVRPAFTYPISNHFFLHIHIVFFSNHLFILSIWGWRRLRPAIVVFIFFLLGISEKKTRKRISYLVCFEARLGYDIVMSLCYDNFLILCGHLFLTAGSVMKNWEVWKKGLEKESQ
ncbi:uncharacterized protein B0T23DRAFT_383127 [Neurospora hispaniola]|uniref:Transmembrane protein n=1 Tax=Neurospora hispaniola TaxID=588809 RepID=A0AAJ0MQP2_9PEZI|nr:hypothetical protein B0T23DRAFT_383127 [Neurospora hispaniola]